MEKDPFKEYLREYEPDKVHKGYAWSTAIGLQAVDGLKTSKYLIDTAIQNIEGKITMKEAQSLIDSYYEERTVHLSDDERTEEADKVSSRIAEILSETAFSFSPNEYISIHRKLFQGIYNHAGKIRDYNFTKKEWILNNDTVIYASYQTIMETLKYDFEQEKNFSYKDLSFDEAIKHLCRFTSNIWQVHPFCEGNTRTTAVFIIKYLRTFGFNINDEVFAKHSWYFRNSLVRANYKKFDKNIFEDISFLEKFFYNLLANTNYELKNRYTHVDYLEDSNEKDLKSNSLTLEEQAIINIIKDNPTIKQAEIAKQINKSLRTVKTRMLEMQEKGIIARENGKKNSEWIIL